MVEQAYLDLPSHGDDQEHDEVDNQDRPKHGDVEQREEGAKQSYQNRPYRRQPEQEHTHTQG